MGENGVGGESILGELVGEEAYRVEDDHLSITQNIAYLHNYYADKLKYVQRERFGYNKCKLSSTLKAALMVESHEGREKA